MSEIEILTVQQVAEALQVSPDSVSRLIRRGELPALKVGRQWRIRKTDLEKFMAQRLTYYGPYGIEPRFYRYEVLDKYRNDPRYYFNEGPFGGKLGLKDDLKLKKMYGWIKPPDPTLPRLFCEVRYNKVGLKNGQTAVVIRPNEEEKIKDHSEESKHWSNHCIWKPEIW